MNQNYFGTISDYGCIAEHLGHSFSGEIHHLIGLALAKDMGTEPYYHYKLQELTPEQLQPFFVQRAFRGINVTIPYKQVIIPYLDELTPMAQEIGAVNTVVQRHGRLIGDNTDFGGMQYLLSKANIDLKGKKVLILGTGGTSNTAYAVAKHGGANEIFKVSRRPQDGCLTYEELPQHLDANVIINTTPVGMYPKDECCPLPAGCSVSDFKALCGVVDAIYHPLRTELVSAAQACGIAATGGLAMLVAQAVIAAEHFLDRSIPREVIDDISAIIEGQKENIVLIGMPACGKTTVGKLLATAMNRELVDTDEQFTSCFGITPADYIQARGEAAFREAEAQVIREHIAPLSGVIVASGGGAILRDENVRRLKRNGKLFFLDRPLTSLQATSDRPLSCSPAMLQKRYEERYGRYCSVADVHLKITDKETPEETTTRILDCVRGA